MKIRKNVHLTQYAIPDGEGFNALPVPFIPRHDTRTQIPEAR
jgi:hypothetical protein